MGFPPAPATVASGAIAEGGNCRAGGGEYSYESVNPLSIPPAPDDAPTAPASAPAFSTAAAPLRPALPAEAPAAMRLILAHAGKPADDEQVADFFRFTARRGIPITDLHVWADSGSIRWAVLPIVNPGRTMLLLGAPVPPSGEVAVQAGVLELCRRYSRQDVQLAQVLLDPGEKQTISAFGSIGFERMAELIYLHRLIRRPPKVPQLPPGFEMQTYSPANHAGFAAAILASYQDSLDCPALNGRRHIDDVIAGHQASGEFDPASWFLLSKYHQPVAVLLLNRSGAAGGMELVYLGLAPAVRGMGLGHSLMCFAQTWMHEQKLASLTLAVDAINTPALRLYHRHGLQRVLSKIAMMRELI